MPPISKACSLLRPYCIRGRGSYWSWKLKAVSEWPTPQSVTAVRSFLGLCSYYRRFIQSFFTIARPLHVLTEKNRVFDWTPAAGEAFDTLKQALVTSPILAYPDPNAEFILDTDASNFGIGSVLSQVQDGHEKVIAYYSKTLNQSAGIVSLEENF